MILGAPCFACLYALVGTVCKETLQKKNLPLESEAYYEVGSIEADGTIIKQQTQIEKKMQEKKKNKNTHDTNKKTEAEKEKDEKECRKN